MSTKTNTKSNVLTHRKLTGKVQEPSPKKDINDYPTPPWFMEKLEGILEPILALRSLNTVDVCCSDRNKKYPIGLTANGISCTAKTRKKLINDGVRVRKSGLEILWHKICSVCWMAAPYNNGLQKEFVQKAVIEAEAGVITVGLVQSNVDTKWFQEFIEYNKDCVFIHLQGRLRYLGADNQPSFGNTVVIFGIQTIPDSMRQEIRKMLKDQTKHVNAYNNAYNNKVA
ncbi:MAG: hypothetical protein DRN81_02400 [Thermoproteota archaeon]|nr:MAG: hypothetical protein DRN81_02400 [Candidatus Korarchaeota archaeon]